MTAFASHQITSSWGQAQIELRSVNHRYLDLHFRLPEDWRALEVPFREKIRAVLARGKVDISVRCNNYAFDSARWQLNVPLLEHINDLYSQLKSAVPAVGTFAPMALLQWQGVLQETQGDTSIIESDLLLALEETLCKLQAARVREGTHLQRVLQDKHSELLHLIGKLESAYPDYTLIARKRLQLAIDTARVTVDAERFEAEMVLLLQKSDIQEEIDRLHTHAKELLHLLMQNEPVGRALDFLMQELNREANTIASKSHDTVITRLAMDVKVVVEQMREQVQNIE